MSDPSDRLASLLPPGVSFARLGPERIARVEAALMSRMGSVVAVAESVRRRHNVSTILRSSEAFGIHEVHLVTEGFKVSLGAARGAERWLERRRFDTTADSLADLRIRGFRIFVADLLPGAHTPEDVPVDQPLAVVFGSEIRGVSPEARAAADGAIRIPMYGLTGSLNVSVSAAIILRAVSERRRALVGADLDPEVRRRFFEDWIRAEVTAEEGRSARVTIED
jgi:tRNA (guanosine-2'-O-)-methyltransferase